MAAITSALEAGIGGAHNVGYCNVVDQKESAFRVGDQANNWIHLDRVYGALLNAASIMENRLQESLKNYQEHPDVQANLQQLQYDLQSWNLALTTMTNIQKGMSDAMHSIASNFK